MFAQINGLKIFYERHLGAEAVVVLHGWGGSHKTTKCIYELLGKWNYDVINVDFPGFGNSDEPKNFGIYDYAQNKIEKVQKVFLKEYFYLHDTEVYEELNNYIENDLYDTFDGKLSYAYRFEAIPDGHPTTFDDYSKALQRINEIIEKYTK